MCFERCIKFVSSYAYIFVYMDSKGFCTACFNAYQMTSANPIQISINTVVQRVLFAMQTITIPVICTSCAYWTFLSESGELENADKLSPSALIGDRMLARMQEKKAGEAGAFGSALQRTNSLSPNMTAAAADRASAKKKKKKKKKNKGDEFDLV